MEAESPPSRDGYWRQREPGVRGNRRLDDDVSSTRHRLSYTLFDNDEDDDDSPSRKGKTPTRPPSGGLRKIHVRNPFDDSLFSGDEESSPTASRSGAKENDPLSFAFAQGTALLSNSGGGTRQMHKRLQKMGDNNNRRQQPRNNNKTKAFASANSYDSDDNRMMTSPYVSPSTYITMDGRCVMSENPFSPMNTEEWKDGKSLRPVAPSIPFSFDTDESSHQPTRHRLEKRNASPMDSLLAPSFMDTSSSSSPDSPTASTLEGHKVRRLGMEGDVHFPTKHNTGTKLFVDTATAPRYKSSPPIDEISPTDVSSFPDVTLFPTPPTPAKYRKRDPNYLSAPPGTPPLRRTMHCPSGPLTASRYQKHENDASPFGGGGMEASTSRFQSDFDMIDELGKGTFGVVYKVLSRLDGCMYAMKVALRSAKGNLERKRMLQEVYALAALSDHADPATFHIVRYHQAFIEDNRLYIQTELCTWNLANEIQSSNGHLSVDIRYKLLREMLLALEFIHKHDMVHLDIKPQNIFVKKDTPPLLIFKLGDFGLVSKISTSKEVEEGDSRYMSMELLLEDHQDLKASDVFSLGATLYEICLERPLPTRPLPTNGPEWQAIRAGVLQPFTQTPSEMEAIVRQMMHPTVPERPSASDLLRRPQLLSKEQRLLIHERNKIFQAKAELAQQVRDLYKHSPPTAGPLQRRNTWSGAAF